MSLRVAVTCPFCKRPMATSAAFAGQMVACPTCRGEFLLNSPALAPPSQPVAEPAAAPGPPVLQLVPQPVALSSPTAVAVADPPAISRPPATAARPVSAPLAAPSSPASPTGVPQPPPNTARFKTAATQAATVVPAADGKLPTLQLADGQASGKGEAGEKAVPLWLALLAVMASTGLSAFLLLGDPAKTNAVDRRAEARQEIEKDYFGSDVSQLRLYQVLLREAQQAHSRGDRAAERQRYRQVLSLLRAEGRSQFEGLTGSPRDDDRLVDLLSILLADG